MSEPDEEDSKAMVRRVAELEIASLAESRKMLLEEHSAAFRWLVASLLATNGGAAVAILNMRSLENSLKLWPCVCFFVGVLLALLIGPLSQRANRRMIEPLGHLMGYWVSVAVDGIHDEAVHKPFVQATTKAMRKAWLTQIAGWLSAIAFAIGAVFSAYALTVSGQSRPNEIVGFGREISTPLPVKFRLLHDQ